MKRAVLIRPGAGVFVLFAILAALLEVAHKDEISASPAPDAGPAVDPPMAELRRCQSLGEAALDDPSCAELWAETHRRFLSPGSPSDESE